MSATVIRTYVAIWATTITSAILACPWASAVRHVLGADLEPQKLDASALAVIELAGHNLLVASLPLWLVAMGAATNDVGRLVSDVLTAGTCLANAGLVGVAIGGYGLALLPYIPQLPFEWAVLACTGASWLIARRRGDQRLSVSLIAAATVLAVAAAVVELRLTPHA